MGDIIVKGIEFEVIWLMIESIELYVVVLCILVNFDEFKCGICWVVYMWYMGIDDLGCVVFNDLFCLRDDDCVGFEF